MTLICFKAAHTEGTAQSKCASISRKKASGWASTKAFNSSKGIFRFLTTRFFCSKCPCSHNFFSHRMGKLELLWEEFGHKLLLLPPYSPEYNPIEKTGAHIKKHLKKVLLSCNTFYEILLSCSCFNRLYYKSKRAEIFTAYIYHGLFRNSFIAFLE